MIAERRLQVRKGELEEAAQRFLQRTRPGFDDIRVVWEESWGAREKGEFETTDQFLSRRSRLLSNLLFFPVLKVPLGADKNTLGRARDSALQGTQRSRYDMDRRVLLVWLMTVFPANYRHSIDLLQNTTSSRYAAQNAFGAKIDVDRMTGTVYNIEPLNLSEFVRRRNRQSLDEVRKNWFVEVAMDPKIARDQSRKSRTTLALAVRLDADYGARLERLRSEPTFANPKETDVLVRTLPCEVQAVIAYDRETRELYQVVMPFSEAQIDRIKP